MLPDALPKWHGSLVFFHVDSLICVSNPDIHIGGSIHRIASFSAQSVVFAPGMGVGWSSVEFGHLDDPRLRKEDEMF
jgi:hypothetical protein